MQSKVMFWGQIWHLHHGHAHFFFMLGMHLCPAQRQCHHCGQKSHPTHAASSCSSSFLQLGQMLGVRCSVCKCTSVNSLTWKKNWIIYIIPSLFVFLVELSLGLILVLSEYMKYTIKILMLPPFIKPSTFINQVEFLIQHICKFLYIWKYSSKTVLYPRKWGKIIMWCTFPNFLHLQFAQQLLLLPWCRSQFTDGMYTL